MKASEEVWQRWALFQRQTAKDWEEIERIRADPDLNVKPKGRGPGFPEEETAAARLEREIRLRIAERREALVTELRPIVERARKAAIDALPTSAEARAALQNPARAKDLREMATGMPASDLRLMAEHIAHKRDLAAAAGLRQAIRAMNLEASDPQAAQAIVETLNGISGDSAEAARAELVGAQWALAGLEVGSERFDARIDPTKALTAYRMAAAVPADTDGEVTSLSQAEVDRMLELVGMSRVPPGLKAAGVE